MNTFTYLRHLRIQLALHQLRAGNGRNLLILHGLGDSAARLAPPSPDVWPGPVFALDFTGHGASSVPRGGGYTCEILLADADIALNHLGEATLLGHGLGGYIALMLAGARPERVMGTVIADGPGITGGSSGPTSARITPPLENPDRRTPDPIALMELTSDIRPPDYANAFARLALQNSTIEDPITVCVRWQIPWLDAVISEPGVLNGIGLDDALKHYA